MANDSPRRIYLLDLVAAVILCGVIAAMFVAGSASREPALLVPVLIVVIVAWLLVRSRRSGPTCDECGRRFQPDKRLNPATHCPHCGEPRVAVRRLSWRRMIVFWSVGVLIAICVVPVPALALDPQRFEWGRLIGFLIAVASGLSTFVAVDWLVATRPPRVHAAERICAECGRLIPLKPTVPLLCPRCRSQKLSLAEARKEQDKSLPMLILTFAVLVLPGIFCLVQGARSVLSFDGATGFPLGLVLAPVPLFFAWKLLVFMIRSKKLNRSLSDPGALDLARACAGETGTVGGDGLATVWYSGPEDPVPMVREEMLASHRRFESLLGETDIADPPVRIFCFQDRDALLKFYKATFPGFDLAAHLGIYFQRPWRILVLCIGEVLGRLEDPQWLAGSLYDQVLLEQLFPTLPAPWVQPGLARALAACGRSADLVGLNRRMVASLSGGTAWSEDLFSTSARKMSKLVRRTNDPVSTRRAEQFNDQSWSIVEYLGGEQAPPANKAALRAFLKDKRSYSDQEESFFRHFGFGFGSLIDSWRQWVLDQGIGVAEPPTSRVRDALVNRVLPVIRDGRAPRADRIQAIRDWRKAGVTPGADALIALLREPGGIPKEEIIWALDGASGMSWGDEPERWQIWWDGLPKGLHQPDDRSIKSTEASS